MAIWLGLLLDGIPESLVIGATAGAIRVSFIVGIALSNYPEALASSVGMREQAFAWRVILVIGHRLSVDIAKVLVVDILAGCDAPRRSPMMAARGVTMGRSGPARRARQRRLHHKGLASALR